MPSNTYDVIVIGDDPPGLIAAALCARRGLRVLVTETAATPVDKLQIGRFTTPRMPMVSAGELSPAVRRVVAELNFIQTFKRRMTPLKPAFQVLLPDARIDVGPDNDQFARELERELPGERAAIEGFLVHAAEVSRVLEPVLEKDLSLPPDGFWERREMARHRSLLPGPEDLLGALPEGGLARALVELPAAFTLGTDPRETPAAAVARAFDLLRRGASRLDGGRDTLKQMLLDKLRTQHAGEVRQVEAGGIVTSWGRAQGVTVRGRDETLGATHILCAQPIAEFGDLFADKRPKRVRELERLARPGAYRFTVNLVIDEAGIPEGIAPLAFCVFDPHAPLCGDNAFAIHTGEPGEDARVPVSIVANAPAPGDGENLDDLIAALRPRLLARLEAVMPFYAEHLVFAHCPQIARPPDGVEHPGKIPVLPAEPLWSLPDAVATLGCGLLPYETGLRGVTTASLQNLPGLGLEGEFAAAWYAARLACAATGKKKDYLKDEVLAGS